jgi:hypothetical protein
MKLSSFLLAFGLSTFSLTILCAQTIPGSQETQGKGMKSQKWIGLSPYTWEFSDSKSYTTVSAGVDVGRFFRKRSNLMWGYTLAAALHHNRSLEVLPNKPLTARLMTEARLRQYISKKPNGLFLEGGLTFFLNDTINKGFSSLMFSLGGYAAFGYQKTVGGRVLIMPNLQYRHNDYTTGENGLFMRLGLGYLLYPRSDKQ